MGSPLATLDMAVQDFSSLPFYHTNHDLTYLQDNIPLPDNKDNLPYVYKTYDDVDEPIFDPSLHLDLKMPESVKTLPEYKQARKGKGGNLAFSKPFSFLSARGLAVIRKIVERETPTVEPSRGSRIGIRGLYFSSPWVRDLHSCPLVLDHVSNIVGEKVVITHNLPSAPHINSSVPGAKGAAEFWHWDSIGFVGNFLITDTNEMDGGDLEIIKKEKHAGMKALVEGNLRVNDIEKVSYEAPGKMVLAQGSEILHHVTPIKSLNKRTVVVFCFAPANVFKPDKMVLQTYIQEDKPLGNKSAIFDFFRGRAWVCGNALVGMTKSIPYTENGEMLAERLRSVAEELTRCADLVAEKTNDAIGFFDESKGAYEEKYKDREN